MYDERETPAEQRKEVFNLSNEELMDELTRPTDNWKEDVIREALRRLLENARNDNTNNKRIK